MSSKNGCATRHKQAHTDKTRGYANNAVPNRGLMSNLFDILNKAVLE